MRDCAGDGMLIFVVINQARKPNCLATDGALSPVTLQQGALQNLRSDAKLRFGWYRWS